MPAPWGVTATGFSAKTLAEVRDELEAAARAAFGPAANVDSRSRLGQFIDAVAEQVSDVWQLGAALAQALNPAGVTGQQLDFLCALNGVTRQVAAKTRVALQLLGTNGTVVALGKVVGQPGTSNTFATISGVTIATLPLYSAYGSGAAVALATLVQSAGEVWRCIFGGNLGSPITAPGTGTASPYTDGTVIWARVGTGTAAVEVLADCSVTGPVQAFAGSCTVINTPVGGWASVTNVTDAAVGNDIESDTALRVRRLQALAAQGKSPTDAIRAGVLATAGVTSCVIFENTTDSAAGGVPAHAFEALIEGGLDADIRATLFATKSAGIETSGTTSGTITDSGGQAHTLKFSRPTPVPIYAAFTLAVDPVRWPADGVAQVQAAALAAIAAHQVGADVYATRIASSAFAVPGVLSSTCTVGTAPSPVGSSVAVDVRSRAANTGTVTVPTLTYGSP